MKRKANYPRSKATWEMRLDENESLQVGMKFESLVELMKLVEIERNEDWGVSWIILR